MIAVTVKHHFPIMSVHIKGTNHRTNFEQFKHIRIPNEKNESDVKISNIDTEGCMTHTMSTKNDSSLIHTQNISNDILKHTSDDPSAPTYPIHTIKLIQNDSEMFFFLQMMTSFPSHTYNYSN